MAQSEQEIARDIVVAWLSHNDVRFDFENPGKTGESIGKIYTAVLEAVQSTAVAGASVTIKGETAPERRRKSR
jgi:hypothetical protein